MNIRPYLEMEHKCYLKKQKTFTYHLRYGRDVHTYTWKAKMQELLIYLSVYMNNIVYIWVWLGFLLWIYATGILGIAMQRQLSNNLEARCTCDS